MKRYSKKGLERRKEERKGYGEFFEKHVGIIKNTSACCAECGARLKGHVSEIAHILPKGYFKSVATNDENVVYMCGMYSTSQCHTNFDNFPIDKFQEMLVFSQISHIFAELEEKITEKINYKVYDKYIKE
ncbi:MAG: hypothetical protein ACI9TV_003265 [Sulfurimonas sp.]|jgi:hypothetical protein|uniref:hypothetical protein n=1 Tax=Sulfurimonas sp. TaxID=2022749 RepID=UPI0039E44289